jgi:NADPH2:quinone reductase
VQKIWTDFDRMVELGAIKPVVYNKEYKGLDKVIEALEDMEARKVWGRAVVTLETATKPKI